MKKTIIFGMIFAFFLCAGYVYTISSVDIKKIQPETEEVLLRKKEITADTEMIYQYFYTEDRVTKEQTEEAPMFLQGLDFEQLQSVYNGWQIVYFSPEKVMLRCKIEGKSNESYILGEENGYLAVFYEDGQKIIHLHERTDIPISALPDGESRQIKEGMRVIGEENLARVLADYMS